MPYATSSGGVFGLSKALAPRLAEDGIRVNLLLPGNVDTPLKRRAEEAMNASGRARNPVVAEPAGVARVVRFPLSDEADYVPRRGVHAGTTQAGVAWAVGREQRLSFRDPVDKDS